MGDDKLVLGFLVGLLIGFPLGWVLAMSLVRTPPQSIIFERDERGRIRKIHYIGASK
jgi:hypothetical protein